MNFFEQTGLLLFGTRLRRLSEQFLSEVNSIYRERGIEFDASWFPVFFLLSQKQPISLREIADELAVSHSAISQLISQLQKRDLVLVQVSPEDARRKDVGLSPKGEELLSTVQPVWRDMQSAMEKLVAEGQHSRNILCAIREIEGNMEKQSLRKRVNP